MLKHMQDTQPRICGGWVAALPELLVVRNGNEFLPTAVKTLALSIAYKQALGYGNPTAAQSIFCKRALEVGKAVLANI
jgi:hypothetical protein